MKISEIIGKTSSSDTQKINRERIHQGWWRAFVLNMKQGEHPINKNEKICNTIPSEEEFNGFNFINKEISEIAELSIKEHKDNKYGGLVDENRLRKNLLSSQPLCFNFFGFLEKNKSIGLSIVQYLFPEITEFHGVGF